MIPKGHYHLCGVAGVGMSALAQVIRAQGCEVSGSDRDHDSGRNEEVIGKLKAAGIGLYPQDGSGVRAGTKGVVVSTAIENDNPDLAAAQRHGVPVVHRAEMLARLAQGKRCMAITGTAGKSTVTGMAGWMLKQLGADPTVVNGAAVLNWATDTVIGNVRIGGSDLWVIEADESDRSLMAFHPEWAVVTNVSKDHFELAETEQLFRRFMGQASAGVISPLETPGLFADFHPEVTEAGSSFRYGGVVFEVPLPGRHNAENAFYAVLLCEKLGCNLSAAAAALATFRGIHRRLEVVGRRRGVAVIDDYAHNPAKIDAAWAAVGPHGQRLLAVWRPHGYKPLAMMMDDLAGVFARRARPADRVFVLPVYDAGGTANRNVRSEQLVEKLKALGIRAEAAADPESLPGLIAAEAAAGDIVLIMGARDPGLPRLARQVLSAL